MQVKEKGLFLILIKTGIDSVKTGIDIRSKTVWFKQIVENQFYLGYFLWLF